MSKHELTIDPEFRSLCPPQTKEELEHLTKSLEEDGCREPIIVWANHANTILDGHTRYERCRELDIPFKVSALVMEDRHAAMNWIIRNQLGRRNATEEQSYLRGKWYAEIKGEQGGDRKSKGQNVTLIDAAEKVAGETGVTGRTVKRDAAFAEAVDALGEKSPALRDAALAGEIPKGAVSALAEQPKSEIRKIEQQEGPELRGAVQDIVRRTLPRSGIRSNPARVWHEVTAAIGILKNRIDALNRAHPHTNDKREALRHAEAIEQIVSHWKRAVG